LSARAPDHDAKSHSPLVKVEAAETRNQALQGDSRYSDSSPLICAGIVELAGSPAIFSMHMRWCNSRTGTDRASTPWTHRRTVPGCNSDRESGPRVRGHWYWD